MAGLPKDCLAFSSNRRRRGFALSDVGLRGGCDAKERHRQCGQQSECFHGTILSS